MRSYHLMFAGFAAIWLSSSLPAHAQTPSSSPAPPSPTAASALATGPFAVQSPDGKSRLRIGGLLQSDLHAFVGGGETGNGSFSLRRARPTLDGALFDFVEFRLMTEFGEGRVSLQDGYLDVRLRPDFRVRSGKFKVPYSLERLQNASEISFIERSLANNLVPVRDVGLMLLSGPGKSGFEWELGVFNGVVDNSSGDGNGDKGMDTAARFFYRPYLAHAGSRLQNLGFGVAGTIGSVTEPVTSEVLRTAGRSSFFHYTDGVFGNGERTRIAPQAFFYSGSFGFMGEHFTTQQRLRKGAVRHTNRLDGLNVQATYVLTGEHATFRNVVPKHPFDPATGHGGAYELAVRYSNFRADGDTFRSGLADPAVSAQKADAITVGINAYLNRQVKAQFDFEHTDFGRSLQFSTGGSRVEDCLMTALQLSF